MLRKRRKMDDKTFWNPVKVTVCNGFVKYTKTKYECGFCKKVYDDKITYCPYCDHYMKKEGI